MCRQFVFHVPHIGPLFGLEWIITILRCSRPGEVMPHDFGIRFEGTKIEPFLTIHHADIVRPRVETRHMVDVLCTQTEISPRSLCNSTLYRSCCQPSRTPKLDSLCERA